jgi:hypothetical protein
LGRSSTVRVEVAIDPAILPTLSLDLELASPPRSQPCASLPCRDSQPSSSPPLARTQTGDVGVTASTARPACKQELPRHLSDHLCRRSSRCRPSAAPRYAQHRQNPSAPHRPRLHALPHREERTRAVRSGRTRPGQACGSRPA